MRITPHIACTIMGNSMCGQLVEVGVGIIWGHHLQPSSTFYTQGCCWQEVSVVLVCLVVSSCPPKLLHFT